MCGLVGIAGNLFKADIDIFNEMLVADTFRGVHSTGVAAVPVNKTYAPSILKSTVPGWEFVTENSRYKDVVDNTAHILIGHNRHATVGGVTKRNAHPFYVNDSIVGAHNGTLTNRLKVHDQSSFGTDSEAALNMMAVKSELETLQTIQGAWAFVWYNYATNMLNFTRNSQRTLAIVRSKNMTRLAWASEGDMLRWILGRDKRNRNEWEDVHELEPNQIVSFEVPAKAADPFGKPRVVTYKESVPVSNVVPWKERDYYGGVDYYGENYGARRPPVQQQAGKPPTTHKPHGSTTKSPPSLEGVPLKGEDFAKAMQAQAASFEYRDASGKLLENDEAIKKYTQGECCSLCGSPIQPEERWRAFGTKNFVCETCIESPGTAEYLKVNMGVAL